MMLLRNTAFNKLNWKLVELKNLISSTALRIHKMQYDKDKKNLKKKKIEDVDKKYLILVL